MKIIPFDPNAWLAALVTYRPVPQVAGQSMIGNMGATGIVLQFAFT